MYNEIKKNKRWKVKAKIVIEWNQSVALTCSTSLTHTQFDIWLGEAAADKKLWFPHGSRRLPEFYFGPVCGGHCQAATIKISFFTLWSTELNATTCQQHCCGVKNI